MDVKALDIKGFRPSIDPHTSNFAVSLLKKLHKLDQNLVVSPLTVLSSLTMALPGAVGNTRVQLLSTLFDEDVASRDMADKWLQQFARHFNTNLHVNKDILSIANLAYLRHGVPLSDQFVATVLEHFKVHVKNLDFTNMLTVGTTITADIKSAIKSAIPCIELGISPADCLILLSIVCFKAQWDTAFAEWKTNLDGDFTQYDGKVVKTAMMCDYNRRCYYEDKVSHTKAVSLSYRTRFDASSHNYQRIATSLVLILPPEGTKIDSFIRSFTGVQLDHILAHLNNRHQVKLKMPRFRVRGEHSLKSCLQALGLVDAFDPEEADFANIKPHSNEDDPFRVFISQAKQSALFAVDENGTLASVSAHPQVPDAMSAPRTGEKVEFNADRPFLYAVVANSKPRQILFIGVVAKFPE